MDILYGVRWVISFRVPIAFHITWNNVSLKTISSHILNGIWLGGGGGGVCLWGVPLKHKVLTNFGLVVWHVLVSIYVPVSLPPLPNMVHFVGYLMWITLWGWPYSAKRHEIEIALWSPRQTRAPSNSCMSLDCTQAGVLSPPLSFQPWGTPENLTNRPGRQLPFTARHLCLVIGGTRLT